MPLGRRRAGGQAGRRAGGPKMAHDHGLTPNSELPTTNSQLPTPNPRLQTPIARPASHRQVSAASFTLADEVAMIRLAIATALILAAPSASSEPAATTALPAGTFALAGPPWISIESPPNPFNSETRGALLVVRVYHHGEAAFYPVSGTAEGLQNGKRQSMKLEFGSTSTPGMYSLKFSRPSAGAWLLMIHVGEPGEHGQATAVVSLDAE